MTVPHTQTSTAEGASTAEAGAASSAASDGAAHDGASDNDAARLDGSGFSTLVVEERGDRLHARLDRPEVRNAIDQSMVDELHAVCAHLEAHPKVLIL